MYVYDRILASLSIAFVFSDCNMMIISSIYSFSTSFQSQLARDVVTKKKSLSFILSWKAGRDLKESTLGTNSFNEQKN